MGRQDKQTADSQPPLLLNKLARKKYGDSAGKTDRSRDPKKRKEDTALIVSLSLGGPPYL